MTFVAIDIEKEKPKRLNPMLFELDEFEKCIYQKAKSFMSNDENIFHNIYHVDEMINQLNRFKATMNSHDYKKIFIAACYHDAVHVPMSNDNEKNSVILLNKDFGKSLTEEDFEDIKNMILSTNKNFNQSNIKQHKNYDLLHDLDLISFIDYDVMKHNDVKIRTEYNNLSTLEFYEYKLKYLNELIKNKIFISSFYKMYNNVATNNISNYIEEISKMIEEFKKKFL
jgi:predicted metal-dependent HD superfamily phosphohydrolase